MGINNSTAEFWKLPKLHCGGNWGVISPPPPHLIYSSAQRVETDWKRFVSKNGEWKERSIILGINRVSVWVQEGGGPVQIFFLILAIFCNMWKNYSIFESKKAEIASSWHFKNAVDFKFQLLFEKFVKEEKGCSPPRIWRAQKKGRKYIAIQI